MLLLKDLARSLRGRKEAAVMLAEFDEFMEEYKSVNAGKESPRVLVLMGLPGSYIVATDNSYVGSLVKLAAARMSMAMGTVRNSSQQTQRICSRKIRT